MIDPYVSAEMSLQPPDDLRSKRYFRQHIEHLLTLSYVLFYKFNVHMGFPTGCDAMQQANLFEIKTQLYFMIGILLRWREFKINKDIFWCILQPVYTSFLYPENSFLNEPF